MGWETSFIGYPLTDESPTPDGIGRFSHFQGGSIFWTPNLGAHEVHDMATRAAIYLRVSTGEQTVDNRWAGYALRAANLKRRSARPG